MEIIIFGIGLIIGGLIIWILKPYYLDKLYAQRDKDWGKSLKRIRELEDENNILSNPKRLIKEYKGDTGSSTGELLNSMQQKISKLEEKTSRIEQEYNELFNEKRKLQSEVNQLKEELSKNLQNRFDNAIDEIEKQLKKARNGDTSAMKSAISELEKQSKSLDSGKLWK